MTAYTRYSCVVITTVVLWPKDVLILQTGVIKVFCTGDFGIETLWVFCRFLC